MKKDAGYLVETRSGRGYTKHTDKKINGKIIVYLDDGNKILCSEENMKFIGFRD